MLLPHDSALVSCVPGHWLVDLQAGQGGRVAPAEPDTLVETGAGITLLKESANHTRRPPERPGKVPSALWVQTLDMILSRSRAISA